MGAWPKTTFLYYFKLLICLLFVKQSAWATEPISADAAYLRLQQTGELSAVTITDPFDFADLTSLVDHPHSVTSVRISNVVFSAPVTLSQHTLDIDIRIDNSQFNQQFYLQHCELQKFILSDSILSGDLIIQDCAFNGFTRFNHNQFQSAVTIHNTKFLHAPSFRNAVFSGRTAFLASEFGRNAPLSKATSFANAVFESLAIFNNTRFLTQAKFQSVLFNQDVSFLNTRFEAGAGFRNVHFMGDAEFRFCYIGTADFGNRNNLTLFAKRADFRGCVMQSAHYDYAEFRGETSFVDAHFGAGGASFRYTNFGNQSADFAGVRADGSLNFANANIAALHFYWQEIKQPFLATNPDSKILTAFHNRLKTSGDTNGALDVRYHLESRKFMETVATPLPSASQQALAFIDAFGQRVIVYAERVLWGLPTGYGTKSGRILLLSLVIWLLAALPVIAAKGLLARVSFDRNANSMQSPDSTAKIYQPIELKTFSAAPQFPDSLATHIGMAFSFTFLILFKVGAKSIRYVVSETNVAHIKTWQNYFAALWFLGALLLVLMGLTLANTSPLMSKLIGELLI